MFNLKPEKLYKFVFEEARRYEPDKYTMLIVARDPVQAVKEFNRKTKDKLYNIIEFTQINCPEEK